MRERVEERGFHPGGFLYLGDGLPLIPMCVDGVILEEGLTRPGDYVLCMIMQLGYPDGFYRFEFYVLGGRYWCVVLLAM